MIQTEKRLTLPGNESLPHVSELMEADSAEQNKKTSLLDQTPRGQRLFRLLFTTNVSDRVQPQP